LRLCSSDEPVEIVFIYSLSKSKEQKFCSYEKCIEVGARLDD